MSPRLPKIIFAIVVLAAAGGFFVMFGPPKLMAKTESPDFCASCHVMESQFEAWFHTGAHRSIKCIDCHLPHENIGAYYIWKSIDGMKDAVVFYSGSGARNHHAFGSWGKSGAVQLHPLPRNHG